MKSKVERKLFYLFTGELVALIAFALIWIYYVPDLRGALDYYYSNTAAFILLEFILLQGSLYWYLKWLKLKKREDIRLGAEELRPFQLAKWLNEGLFVLFLLFFLYELFQHPGGNWIYFTALYGFAFAEHINYYYIRLSYFNAEEIKEWKQKGWTKSVLAREIEELGRLSK